MRKLLLSLLCVAALPAGAEELIVEAGEERLLSQPSVHLQRLVLKDGAVLRVAAGLARVELHAEQAWIGRGVQLLGAGQDGHAGANGQAGMDGQGCLPGADGQAGGSGVAGQAGVNLDLRLGLQSFDSLLIDVRGGQGGAGSRELSYDQAWTLPQGWSLSTSLGMRQVGATGGSAAERAWVAALNTSAPLSSSASVRESLRSPTASSPSMARAGVLASLTRNASIFSATTSVNTTWAPRLAQNRVAPPAPQPTSSSVSWLNFGFLP